MMLGVTIRAEHFAFAELDKDAFTAPAPAYGLRDADFLLLWIGMMELQTTGMALSTPSARKRALEVDVPFAELALLLVAVPLPSLRVLRAAQMLRPRVPCANGRPPPLWVFRRHRPSETKK